VHNINYWRRGEYLGLGCSAASFLKGVRSSNDIKLGSYLQTVESGRRPIAEIETPVGMEALGEEAFLGLRLIDGFIPSDALRQAFEGPWAILKARGLACEAGPRWRLTVDGVYLANDVFKEFVPPFQCQEAIA
jgi:oxygen-independent coproporphyrinogen-3 oxidase